MKNPFDISDSIKKCEVDIAGVLCIYIYIYFIFQLSSISNVLSFGRWLNTTEIL